MLCLFNGVPVYRLTNFHLRHMVSLRPESIPVLGHFSIAVGTLTSFKILFWFLWVPNIAQCTSCSKVQRSRENWDRVAFSE